MITRVSANSYLRPKMTTTMKGLPMGGGGLTNVYATT